MRIVFILPHADLSGGVRTVATYARLLSKRGHTVTVVTTPVPRPPVWQRVQALLRGRGWPIAPGSEPSHLDDAGVDHRRLERLRPVTDRDVPDADVVVATWWLTAEWVAALSPRKGAKAHFIQGDDAATPGQPRERVAATWRLPMHRIVCSRWLLDLAQGTYGDPHVSYVPNGVDPDHFSAPLRDKQLRPTLGFVYSDAPIKGVDIATRAISLAARNIPDLRVICFGSGSIDDAVPLPPRAEYFRRPEQAQIPKLYAACDGWLWPSRREGFGLPILEAMACGTPVIATPAGAAPDLLADGGGILLPTADAVPMSEAIVDLMSTPSERWRELAREARTIATRHGWDTSVLRFEDALQRARTEDLRSHDGWAAKASRMERG